MVRINFKCNDCGQIFDYEVGSVNFDDNKHPRDYFSNIVHCPSCDKSTVKKGIKLTDAGHNEIAEMWLNKGTSLPFEILFEVLTGTRMSFPEYLSQAETELLSKAMATVKRSKFNLMQLNEVLLLVNAYTLSEGFFNFFFVPKRKLSMDGCISLKELKNGIKQFRKYAMLVYGSFYSAFRKLSKMTYDEISSELQAYTSNTCELDSIYRNRHPELLSIKKIPAHHLYLLGYVSGKVHEMELSEASNILILLSGKNAKKAISNNIKAERKFEIFSKNNQGGLSNFKNYIKDSLIKLEKVNEDKVEAEKNGALNTSIYLTWSELDVYLATSMRESWEYESFNKFVGTLFKNTKLKKLNLRYFNPTQSHVSGRIDKGLIESLMLKKAKCTIYTVQETDTLGKDSELAVTLAQGKPVIAYVPQIERKRQTDYLKKQKLQYFLKKKNMVEENMKKPEISNKCLKWLRKKYKKKNTTIDEKWLNSFIREFYDKLHSCESLKAWYSIDTTWADEEKFKKNNAEEFNLLCGIMAILDESFYDGRASTLSKTHPLGLQAILKTGVANGVLVVRDIDKCAKLLYNILTNNLMDSLEITYEKEQKCWCLTETISGCIHRVVTDNIKLTNSFWNLYNT